MKSFGFYLVIVLMTASTQSFVYAQNAEVNPTETYEAFHRALRALDMETIHAHWLPDEAIQENEEALTKEILQMRQISPPEVEVRDEKIIGTDAFLKVMGTYPNGGKSEGTVYLVKGLNAWKVKKEKWGFIEVPPPPPAPKGEGIIEGIITLPPVEKEGNLYVFAILENQYYPTRKAVIPKEQIAWQYVPYHIPDLPSGRYWVYAYWDTAPPFMDPEKGDFAVFTGDYAGEFITAVTVAEGERRGRIDFACDRDLKARDEENYGKRYSLVDLGVSMDAEGKPLFLLTVRNTGERPVRNVSLICRINGKDLTYTASAPGSLILPQEVREFDVTACYDSYIFFAEKVWTEENLSKQALKVEIVSQDNDSRLDKEIVVR